MRRDSLCAQDYDHTENIKIMCPFAPAACSVERQLEKASEETIIRLRSMKEQIEEKFRKLSKYDQDFEQKFDLKLRDLDLKLSKTEERLRSQNEANHSAAMIRLQQVDQVRLQALLAWIWLDPKLIINNLHVHACMI